MGKRLVRSDTDRMLFGVAGGLSDYLDIDPVLVRVGFVVLCFAGGMGLIAYIVLAILMPSPQAAVARSSATEQEGTEPAGEREPIVVQDSEMRSAEDRDAAARRRNVMGLILVVVGVFILMANFDLLAWVDWGVFSAVALIAAGIALLLGRWRGA